MIKIEISGAGDEVRYEMLRLLGLQGPTVQTESPIREESLKEPEIQPTQGKVRLSRKTRKPTKAQGISWTEEEAENLLNEIKPNAKRILTELAQKPEGYQRSELIQVLGLKEHALGGQLSSVGSALRGMGRKTSPLSTEKVDGKLVYKLDSAFASMVRQQPI